MALFKSPREKRLWIYALIVLVTIFSTLVMGRPLQKILANQNIQAFIFLIGMSLVGVTIFSHGLKIQPSKTELTIWLGLMAVYLVFFLRLGLPERSHLIEYSVLAIFIHKALVERTTQKNQTLKPALYAFITTFTIGVLDECIQILIPSRIFDMHDIIFNGLVVFMAVGASVILTWVRKQVGK